MNLTLLGPRVVIRPDALPDLSDGGIALLDGGRPSTLCGEVLAVGNGPSFVREAVGRSLAAVKEKLKGLRAADAVDDVANTFEYGHTVKPGDRVVYSPGSGQELVFERELLVCMSEDDILAVVE